MRFGNVDYFGLEAQALRVRTNLWTLIDVGERLIACALLAFASPAILSAGLTIFILSRRSPFIAHERVAKDGKPFWILKLRTMWGDTDSGTSFIEFISPRESERDLAKTRNDPRITSAFGALCRRYSVDELPQFWHVIRGEMALVGPRPLTRFELDRYYGAHSSKLLARKPGLTGLWQISGRSRLRYHQRCRLDLFMIRKWSLALYLRILLTTPLRVLSGKDAW